MRSTWQDPPEYSGGGEGGRPHMAMPPLTPMVKALVIANAVVFLATFAVFIVPSGESYAAGFQRLFGMNPVAWRDWFPLMPVWQLLTWGFLHHVTDITHILFNMLFLYFLGTMLEGIIGSRRFLATYVGALLFSGVVTLAVGLIAGDTLPTVGASGAVFCVVVAMATLRPNARIIFFIFPITLRTLAILYVGMNVFQMLLQLKGATSNVAYSAHLAGAAWGFWVVRKGWIWSDPLQRLADRRADRRVEREREDDLKIDEILAKISREGINSLSLREKAFLKRSSKRR